MKSAVAIDPSPKDSATPAWRRPVVRRKPGPTLTTREIADRLGVSREQALALARRGALPTPTRRGRKFVFDRREAEKAIAKIKREKREACQDGYPTRPPPPRWGGGKAAEPLSSRDAARLLDLGVQTVRIKAKRGEIAGVWKLAGALFFDPDEIRWLRGHRDREREARRAKFTLGGRSASAGGANP
jgi:excisionase family DNA binding protein